MLKIRRRHFLLLLLLLLLSCSSSVIANAAWKKTSAGKMYTVSGSPGYAVGWKKIKNKYYYFNSKGILQKSKWVDNCYVGKNGYRLTGMHKIGKKTYYLDKKTGKKVTSTKIKYKKKFYYFNKKGVLQKSKWINDKYYASKNGQLITGLALIKGNIYFFKRDTAVKMSNVLVKTGGSSYYFKKDGTAVRGQRVLRKGNYYYFGTNGKMLCGGWATINSIKYYFNSSGIMVTGLQTIGGSDYYFYSSGVLAVSTKITEGSTTYTVNSNGVITKTEIASSQNTGKKIVNFAVQYVGNRYVYGGNSLTNGVDCSGFTQQVFLHFGISLPRTADDQMKMRDSWSSATYKGTVVTKSTIQPGDLLFFGSGNYASHVGIYMGNDQFVHASNSQPYPKGGIKISTLSTYPTTLLRIIRYW